MLKNEQKSRKTVKNCQKFQKRSTMAKNGQNCLKRQKYRKTVKKTVKNVEKQLKILKKKSKNCQKSRKTVKIF